MSDTSTYVETRIGSATSRHTFDATGIVATSAVTLLTISPPPTWTTAILTLQGVAYCAMGAGTTSRAVAYLVAGWSNLGVATIGMTAADVSLLPVGNDSSTNTYAGEFSLVLTGDSSGHVLVKFRTQVDNDSEHGNHPTNVHGFVDVCWL